MFRKKTTRPPSVITQERFDTLLGRNSEIRGDLKVAESLRIDGRLIGNVLAQEGHTVTVVVGSHGCVSGNIQAQRVLVAGKVQGSIVTTDEVELHPEAVVEGDIQCGSVSIAHGAQVLGRLTASREPISADTQNAQQLPTPIGHTRIERVA